MSDSKDNKKKGFFSRLLGGFSSPKVEVTNEVIPAKSEDIPTKSALNKMKKADIVEAAKNIGLELNINLTKAQLLDAWNDYFSKTEIPSAVDDAATAMSESAENIRDNLIEAAPEDVPVEEEAAPEEVPVEEEAAPEEVPVEEEAALEEVAEEQIKVSLEEKTPSQIINDFESKQMKSEIPSFRPGDTVAVSVKVKEGERTRLQVFEGIVMGVKKGGLNSSFIVRKISSGVGVERTFQTHSPLIDSIEVKRKGDVRQAKLFYLRERSGKSARIKERLD